MSLLYLFLTLIAVGVVLYVVNAYVPMDPKIKNILNVVAVLIVVIWLLQVFGIFAHFSSARVPTLK